MKCYAEVGWELVNDGDLVYIKGTDEDGGFVAHGPHRVDNRLCCRLRNHEGRSFINRNATIMALLSEAK